MSAKKILSLGQCAADHGSITSLLRRQFGADVVSADTFAEAAALLRQDRFDLVLVNRVLDHDHTSGLDCIAALQADAALAQVPIMLVSNLPDAQQQAAALGALPGFGKAGLGAATTLARLRAVLGDAAAT